MAVVLGLVTAFAWAFSNVFTQKAARTSTPPVALMFSVLLISAAAVLPIALLVDGLRGPWTIEALTWPVAGGALSVVEFGDGSRTHAEGERRYHRDQSLSRMWQLHGCLSCVGARSKTQIAFGCAQLDDS